jgi:hypothetical protein
MTGTDGGHAPARAGGRQGARPPASGGSLLIAGTRPGGTAGLIPGGGVPPTAGGSPLRRPPGQRTGRALRLPSGAGARCSLIARGDTPSTGGQRAARMPRLSSGRRRQSGRTPAALQVCGTDSDTSRRHCGRRNRQALGSPGPRAPTPRRLRFVCDRFTRGPRLLVCLDVARPSCLRLPRFLGASCKARDTFTPFQCTCRGSTRNAVMLAVVDLSCWSFFSGNSALLLALPQHPCPTHSLH